MNMPMIKVMNVMVMMMVMKMTTMSMANDQAHSCYGDDDDDEKE